MLSTSVKNKNECGIYKRNKIILVTFWGYTDNSKKWLIYPYTFLYIIIIHIYLKIYFYLYNIGKKKIYYEKFNIFTRRIVLLEIILWC